MYSPAVAWPRDIRRLGRARSIQLIRESEGVRLRAAIGPLSLRYSSVFLELTSALSEGEGMVNMVDIHFVAGCSWTCTVGRDTRGSGLSQSDIRTTEQQGGCLDDHGGLMTGNRLNFPLRAIVPVPNLGYCQPRAVPLMLEKSRLNSNDPRGRAKGSNE